MLREEGGKRKEEKEGGIRRNEWDSYYST